MTYHWISVSNSIIKIIPLDSCDSHHIWTRMYPQSIPQCMKGWKFLMKAEAWIRASSDVLSDWIRYSVKIKDRLQEIVLNWFTLHDPMAEVDIPIMELDNNRSSSAQQITNKQIYVIRRYACIFLACPKLKFIIPIFNNCSTHKILVPKAYFEINLAVL